MMLYLTQVLPFPLIAGLCVALIDYLMPVCCSFAQFTGNHHCFHWMTGGYIRPDAGCTGDA